jgi:hypothetical protein
MLRPVNQQLLMDNLRDFAFDDGPSTETSIEGLTKDGKVIVEPGRAVRPQRFALWASANGYFNSANTAQGTLGLDYRVAPHLLLGAYVTSLYTHRATYQGGVYAALYEQHFWLVAGGAAGQGYTGFASAGYDLVHVGNWLFGPAVALQYDNSSIDYGLGKGQVLQGRAGVRLAYQGRLSPSLQIMYQRQALDNDPTRDDAIWIGLGLRYQVNSNWSLFADYSLEANGNYQASEATLGVRFGF